MCIGGGRGSWYLDMEVKQDLPEKKTFGQIPMIRNETCEEGKGQRGEPGRGKNAKVLGWEGG